MKTLLLIVSALIFLLVVATVDAGARHKAKHARQQSTHHVKPSARQMSTAQIRLAKDHSAYAQAPFAPAWEPMNPRSLTVQRSLNPAHDVYVAGLYIGSDPDPHVRSTLIRDWTNH